MFVLISILASIGFTSVGASSLGNTLGWHGHNHTTLVRDVHGAGFGGDVMSRVFPINKGLPVGDAALNAAGWHKTDDCDSALGFAWTWEASGATTLQPLKLYTNADGLPSGVGTVIRKYLPPAQKKYATTNPIVGPAPGLFTYHIDIGFRAGDQCQAGLRTEQIGDQLVVNPGGTHKKTIPLTEAVAAQDGWQKGSCFNGMGWHRFFNTAGKTLPMEDGNWNKGDLFPVVAMYDNDGDIHAIFFASIQDQYTYKSGGQKDTNEWEGRTLDEFMMCKNMCGKCGFNRAGSAENSDWATMHIYFKDHTTSNVQCTVPGKSITCFVPPAFGGMGCCENTGTAASIDQQPPSNMTFSGSRFFGMVSGGLGLLVGVLLTLVVVRKQSRAREVQVSEMASTAC